MALKKRHEFFPILNNIARLALPLRFFGGWVRRHWPNQYLSEFEFCRHPFLPSFSSPCREGVCLCRFIFNTVVRFLLPIIQQTTLSIILSRTSSPSYAFNISVGIGAYMVALEIETDPIRIIYYSFDDNLSLRGLPWSADRRLFFRVYGGLHLTLCGREVLVWLIPRYSVGAREDSPLRRHHAHVYRFRLSTPVQGILKSEFVSSFMKSLLFLAEGFPSLFLAIPCTFRLRTIKAMTWVTVAHVVANVPLDISRELKDFC